MSFDLLIVGLGYVGLPLARAASDAGLSVAGYDIAPTTVAALRAGRSPVRDVTDADVARMLDAGFTPADDPELLTQAQAVALCVPTGLSPEGQPDLGPLTAACRTVAERLRSGMLVVLESTSFPGTTEELARPLLEASGLVAGVDFHLGYSPERVDPANRQFGIGNTPKVVSGVTPVCAKQCAALYERFVDTVVVARGTREAELAKLLENTYRSVNIALVNEFARYCHAVGADVWDVVACAGTKPFGFQSFRPGPGVGGHCIPVDPVYLLHGAPADSFAVVRAALRANHVMPGHVVARAVELLEAEGLPAARARVTLLGAAYKPDTDDVRESPTLDVARGLLDLGVEVTWHDPHAAALPLADPRLRRHADPLTAATEADLVVLLQAHSGYDLPTLAKVSRLLFDTTGRLSGDRVVRL
ncbi:nucleotide sugar dehydrogenase [Streptacidiphilus sp. MAP5-3]|uniref:nucleotide sugar dehydrogenase n=1 Tax=unclassified Streptacidiphilus TaxID=2643834 RepID=UPI003518C43A